MGGQVHDNSRAFARGMGYHDLAHDDIFEQNKLRTAHDSMIPSRRENKAHLRESRDSLAHPQSIPVIIELDITGSMGDIPEQMIKYGLPKMVARMKELGIMDPQVLIIAVGDSINDNDNGVFQLGQFESGDAEMDMWLKRIWISGKGGGNHGESYLWAHYYALNHIETDNWDKRKEKGFIFSIGDDHCHPKLSNYEMDEVMGYLSKGEGVDADKVIQAVKEKWNVYHLDLSRGTCVSSWSKLIGRENVIDNIPRTDYEGMAKRIAETVAANCNCVGQGAQAVAEDGKVPGTSNGLKITL